MSHFLTSMRFSLSFSLCFTNVSVINGVDNGYVFFFATIDLSCDVIAYEKVGFVFFFCFKYLSAEGSIFKTDVFK